jgi:transketolase
MLGIAEQDMISTAAGMATCGKIAYVSTFAVFAAGRGYDQIRNSVCYPKVNVKICATHSGITVGEDGATHQMIEDISLMRTLPNMTVLSTSDDVQTRWAVKEISKINGPVYLRLCRMKSPVIYNEKNYFEIGKAVQIGNGNEATVISTGITTSEAIRAKEELVKEGINIRILDIHTIKPIDKEAIIRCAKETKRIITIEDHNIVGGLGSSVCEVLSQNFPKKVEMMGINDTFGKSGSAEELMKYFKIDKDSIIEKIKNVNSL